MNSLVSIITVNYNNLKGLQLAMESVLEQNFQEFEYIIIDGGSTDGSIEYIESKKDIIDYFSSEPDAGVYDAMNKGIAAATGDYILFLNSGDHFASSTSLANAIPHLGNKDIVYFDLGVVENKTTSIKYYPDELSFSYFVMDSLPHPATFIRRSAFAKAGLYDINLTICADWKFFMDAICKFGCSHKHVDEVLSTFYIGGLSSDPKNYGVKTKEREMVLQNGYAPFIKDIKDVVLLKKQLKTLRSSRIITTLVKWGLLHKIDG
ncbi:Glycosyl transferase family 2 [Nonlabens sp. Hel1_33_55]|uniref:glycosyltransferase family 2 protein n=1 Tax=Nonlabens sp. Hel1_33_55 TaxID=1336802 RepID=UPI000875C07E|nr:glycosyltransferase family 2 protein [Nonlabens sp. Hel1_33_55]SCX92271.1 Glycosyl transferase family 2 [Nonlabens sp. Hel1_33_55]